MKKKKILNVCMVTIVILVAVCGIMAVGSVKGWFDKDASLTIAEKYGIAMVERNGIAYELQTESVVREGDILYTKSGSKLTVSQEGKKSLFLNADTEVQVNGTEKELGFRVKQGELLVDTRGWKQDPEILAAEETVIATEAVFSVSAQSGATTVNVYEGEISVQGTKSVSAKAGETVSVIAGKTGTLVVDVKKFAVASLNEYQIQTLLLLETGDGFCFEKAELEGVIAQREEEILKAQQAQLLLEAEAQEEAEAELAKRAEAAQNAQEVIVTEGETGTSSNVADNFSSDISAGNDSGAGDSSSADAGSSTTSAKYCTIEIRCDTILSNLEDLTPGKEAYVPSNGTILGTSRIEFTEGETVFDVLQKACERASIQLEYSYTPLYESYYIEGINHLYEFDCGDLSGWMYKVNGWFPNYGCSSYIVSEGDVIVWTYTCKDLGGDVGGPVY